MRLAVCVLILLAAAAAPGAAPALATGLNDAPGDAATAGFAGNRYWITVTRQEKTVGLDGIVPDALTRTVLGTYAAALFGAGSVENRLGINGGTVPGDWSVMAMAALDTLSEVEAGRAEMTEGTVLLSGTVPQPVEAGRLTHALRDRLPPGVRVTTEFDVALPAIVERRTFRPERCAWLMTELARKQQIVFASGSAEIAEESLAGLGAIARLFGRCPDAEIEIRGYTDSEGDEDLNRDLSQARAEAVMALMQEEGVPLRQLRARGFGEADPIADNETEAGRATNRRIEFSAIE